MDELRMKLLHEIIRIYGPLQGQSIGAVIIPAFIGDFKKVLEKTVSFDEISEEYMTEDKKIHLVLYGRKELGAKNTECVVTGCDFNETSLYGAFAEVRVVI